MTHRIESEAGPLFGRGYYELRSNHTDKTHKLTLNRTTLRDNDASVQRLYDNPKDKYSVYRVLKAWKETFFPVDWESYVLLREAPEKALIQRESKGLAPYKAGIYRLDGKEYKINQYNPAGKLGDNAGNTLVQEFGRICKFEAHVTARSGRRAAATIAGNSGASAFHQAQKTRHKSDPLTGNTVLPLYQEDSHESASRLNQAFFAPDDVLKRTGQYLSDGEDKKKKKRKKKKKKKKKKKMSYPPPPPHPYQYGMYGAPSYAPPSYGYHPTTTAPPAVPYGYPSNAYYPPPPPHGQYPLHQHHPYGHNQAYDASQESSDSDSDSTQSSDSS